MIDVLIGIWLGWVVVVMCRALVFWLQPPPSPSPDVESLSVRLTRMALRCERLRSVLGHIPEFDRDLRLSFEELTRLADLASQIESSLPGAASGVASAATSSDVLADLPPWEGNRPEFSWQRPHGRRSRRRK